MEPASKVNSMQNGRSTQSGIPVFNEDILASLSKKIENRLGQPSSERDTLKKGRQAPEKRINGINDVGSAIASPARDGPGGKKRTKQGSKKGGQHSVNESQQSATKTTVQKSVPKAKAIPLEKDSSQL
ncbi:MAG: hypothetical protein Q9224_007004, partial [Gallowayella concinna]